MIGYYGHAGRYIGRVVGHLWARHLTCWHYSTGPVYNWLFLWFFSMVLSDDDWIGSGVSVEPVHWDQVGVWVG
jgi:hypothetical protein